MEDTDESDSEKLFEERFLSWMRAEFGIDHTQLVTSSENDDWMLIVKLHAIIETGLNGAILVELERPALAKIIAKLDTSNGNTGKVAFAKALGILEPHSAVFIQKLSELRNICVHDIKKFGFKFSEYLQSICESDRKDLIKAIKKEIVPTFTIEDFVITSDDLMKLYPRTGLAVGTMSVMQQLMVHKGRCDLRDVKRRVLHLKSEQLDEIEKSNPTEW